ncbi:MAG: ABC transporter substrate-binding protein [Thermobacillus sp.]|nr:MAG: ABC transporter substrate-binding protein [Thermobacillus sp.]
MGKATAMRKAVTWLAAAVLLLAACSAGEGDRDRSSEMRQPATGLPEADMNRQVELGFIWWGPEERHKATLAALEVYTAQHPNVTFKPEYMAWEAYWKKLPSLAASKTVPDVLQMDAAYIQDYVSRGIMADLSDIDLTGIVPDQILENVKINGKLYGVPLSYNAQGIAYNRAELEAAGIPLPWKGWTWEEFFDWARDAKTKLPPDRYPIGDSTSAWDWFQWYQASYGGGAIMSPDGREFHLDRELFFEYHTILADLRRSNVVPPADVSLTFLENDPLADQMTSGKVLTRGATVGSIETLEQLMPGKVDVVNVPVGPAGGGWAQPTIFLGVYADSDELAHAKRFVKWFITDREAGRTLGLTRGIPIYEEIYKELEPNLEPKDRLGKVLADVAAEYAMPFYAAGAGFTEWVDAYKLTMEAVMFGQKSLEDAYAELNALGESIAKQNRNR